MVSITAVRTLVLSLGLNELGNPVGVAGLWTLAPHSGDAAAVFGLGFIVWKLWADVVDRTSAST